MIKIFLALIVMMISTQVLAVECDRPVHNSSGDLILINPFQASFGDQKPGNNNELMFGYVFYKNTNFASSGYFYTQGLTLNAVRELADQAKFKGQMLFMTNNEGLNTNNFGVASEKIVDLCK